MVLVSRVMCLPADYPRPRVRAHPSAQAEQVHSRERGHKTLQGYDAAAMLLAHVAIDVLGVHVLILISLSNLHLLSNISACGFAVTL